MGLLDRKNVREKIYPEKKSDNYKKIKSKTKIFQKIEILIDKTEHSVDLFDSLNGRRLTGGGTWQHFCPC